MRLLIIIAFAIILGKTPPARAAEPFLKPGDIIALVGGEDMVVASELGYIETLLQRALPGHKLKFRSLAWEGDTVFEQARDLNYPALDAQLDKIGATVVICWFGKMEGIERKHTTEEFLAAYGNLVEKLAIKKGRRVAMIEPVHHVGEFKGPWPVAGKNNELPVGFKRESIKNYTADLMLPVSKLGIPFIYSTYNFSNSGPFGDGMRMGATAHERLANITVRTLVNNGEDKNYNLNRGWYNDETDPHAPLLKAVVAKNKLWYHYYRPQNWAFLAGDRTNQPSSRDHKDPNKRWFPAELETFLPLIEAKEEEIWTLAAKLK